MNNKLERHSTKEDREMINRYMKNCQDYYIVSETKTTKKHHKQLIILIVDKKGSVEILVHC